MQRIERVQGLTKLLDSCFYIPGTSLRFGLDPLLSLIPFVGDTTSAALSGYIMVIALQLGAPLSVIGRMVLNIVVDMVVGFIPLLGDLADFGLKANTRNMRLLEDYLQNPRSIHRSSKAIILMVSIMTFTVIIVGFIVAYLCLSVVATRLGLPGIW